MEIHKLIKMQDSGLKINPVKSGETGLNLSNEVLQLIFNENFNRSEDSNNEIVFRIFKEDFIKAMCNIMTKFPLYKTTSHDYKQLDFTLPVYTEYISQIDDFFGKESAKDYKCNLLLKSDGRNYLNKLRIGKFSIRDFLIEDYSSLIFGQDEQNILYLRLCSHNSIKEECTSAIPKLLIKEKQHCNFAYKCMMHFKESDIWDNVSKYVFDFNEGDSIKVSKDNCFKLTGMFKYITEEKLIELNSPRRRWYTEPFILKNKNVYLSTEWYPEKTKGQNYQLTIIELGKFISECFGHEYHVVKNNDAWELWKDESTLESIVSNMENKEILSIKNVSSEIFSIEKMISLIDQTGLLYEPLLVKRFAFSLLSKPFLILSGLAGSGKTQLALAFANALIADDSQMCVVSVGADWTNREPLLGFPNALQENKYVRPESGVLDLLIEANKTQNANKPYFLVLDEMNMSYVERYFADFLSAMESNKPISLWKGNAQDGVPQSVMLPKNLFIIGTINVDETTYMFSPKVLDRANVIEFKISQEEMKKFLAEMKPIDRDNINFKAAGMSASFVEYSQQKNFAGENKNINITLNRFFDNLKSVNSEFGYRSATEIYRFISQAQNNDDTKEMLALNDILDCAIVQKLLPKLHGSRKKLEPVLQALWKECFDGDGQKALFTLSRENVNKAKFPLAADKIQRMYEAAYNNGFTSFAEA